MNYNKTISEFISLIGSCGLARPNRYWVEFNLPKGVDSFGPTTGNTADFDYASFLSSFLSDDIDVKKMLSENISYNSNGKLSMMCTSAHFPGRTFMTTESRHYPISFKLPYSAQYDDITFNFNVSGDYAERQFFELWQSAVVNTDNGTLNFYDEYVSNIIMRSLNKTGEAVYSIELINAYPIAIGGLDHAYADQDSVLQLSVTFTYEHWKQLKGDS